MSRKVPVGQVRLTNIAIVKYKAKGLRFEIACFPNKVLDWRKKVEKDLSNVIQSTNIFSNVSKGSFARRDDLLAAFGTLDSTTILKMILDKGELQVTERERQSEIASKTREIISFIAGMCVNSETKQPVSTRVIEEGLKTAAFQINLTQPIKQQAMKLFFVLSKSLPIERAKMKIQIACPAQYAKSIKSLLATYEQEKGIKITNIVQTTHSIEFSVITDPGFLRPMTDEVTERTDGQGDISVVDLQVDTEDLLAAQNMDLGIEDDDDDNNEENGKDKDHFDSNFGSTTIDLESISAAFGTIKSGKNNTNQGSDDDDGDDEETPDLSQYISQPNEQRDKRDAPSQANKAKQSFKSTPKYSDSDDDISFILSKNVTVLKEDDVSINGGPHQVEKMTDFSGYGRKQRSLLDDISSGDEDDRHRENITRRRQKTQGLGRFIGDGGDDDDFQSNDESEDEIPNTKSTQKYNKNTTTTSTPSSSLTSFLHTNIAKAMIGTQVQPLGMAASIREDKSVRVVNKYDPESTLYKEFMQPYDCQEEGYDDVPLLKQDADVLQSIKRQIAFQQQHASDEFEWILEFDEKEEVE